MNQQRHELRDYQVSAVDRTIAAVRLRPILVAPTGSGKTVMATELVDRLQVPTLWMAHRKELIEQAAARLQAHGLDVGIIKAGVAPRPSAPVQVASVATLLRRDVPPAGLIVVDECHHAAADSYGGILQQYPGAWIVGLTATPFRLDGRGLGDLFGEIVVAAWPDELCARGILHRPKVWAVAPPDLSGVRVVAGDYIKGELARRVNTADRNADMVKMWRKHADGRRTVAFAVDVTHSRDIAAAFQAAGIVAEHLDGNTPDGERADILARLKRGVTQVVCNCLVLTEGWDLPALECCIIARPTESLNLHLQMIGRIMRSCPGKEGAIVLDHAGNHHTHGLVTRRLKYSLSAEQVGSSEPLGLRRCEACGLFFETGLPACPDCGWVPASRGATAPRDKVAIHGEGELIRLMDGGFVVQWYGEEKDVSYAARATAWTEIERQRGTRNPFWSFYRYRDCFGVWPLVVAGELVDVEHATIEQKRAVYEQLVATARAKGYKAGWASHRYRDTFGVWPRVGQPQPAEASA